MGRRGRASVFRGSGHREGGGPQPGLCNPVSPPPAGRTVRCNATWETAHKVNSKDPPSCLTRPPTPTPCMMHGSPCIWLTLQALQVPSRDHAHFPDEEAAGNSVPTCWQLSRGAPGSGLSDPLPTRQPHPRGPVLRTPSVLPLSEKLAEAPEIRHAFGVPAVAQQ